MCKVCGSKLIPILYGQLNIKLLDMAKNGQIIIGDSVAIDRPEFYCQNCTEAF
jgi:hypothetical protein